MSHYNFSRAQRYAIFLVHGMKCYLCGTPLDLNSMTIDHVLPEHLLMTPSLLEDTKSELGLPPSFEINSFENWMPACSSCNGKKGASQFKPSLLFQKVLQDLVVKSEEVHRCCDQVISNQKLCKALIVLEKAVEDGGAFNEEIKIRLSTLLSFATELGFVRKGQSLRLTDSLRLETTTLEEATSWGVTHWSMPPREGGESELVVLFREERGECVECGLIKRVFQPINQEGGGDPICSVCLLTLDWLHPVSLGDFPTHVAVKEV